MLSKKQLADVCLFHQGCDACRYLSQDDSDWSKYYCLKLRPNEKAKIDKKINDFLGECKRKGLDPTKQGVPMGDNCSGYPLVKFVEQGYDKKN